MWRRIAGNQWVLELFSNLEQSRLWLKNFQTKANPKHLNTGQLISVCKCYSKFTRYCKTRSLENH